MSRTLALLRRAGLLAALFVLAGNMPAAAAPGAVTWPSLRLSPVASGFSFPVHLAAAHDGSGRIFVVEKAGRIHILQDGQRLPTPFLDIASRVNSSCGECGLLSVAFPPDFAEEGYFFVYYNAVEDLFPDDPPDQNTRDSVIARFRLSADPNRADPDSEEFILTQWQPYPNHNGGQLLFAPDRTLLIGFGDGGGGGDPLEAGQDLSTWLGKILRIQVSASGSYTVPADNPFVDTAGARPEIWAYGLRNPWRFSFGPDGALYIADVGQNAYEEVNVEPSGHLGGSNYGWNIMEGPLCYPDLDTNCDMTDLTLPVAYYDHSLGDCSVTGGLVFTSQAAGQAPVYLYGDWCSGRIRGLQFDVKTQQWVDTILLETDLRITSFGSDEEGNIYVLAANGGIHRVEAVELNFRQWLPVLGT